MKTWELISCIYSAKPAGKALRNALEGVSNFGCSGPRSADCFETASKVSPIWPIKVIENFRCLENARIML